MDVDIADVDQVEKPDIEVHFPQTAVDNPTVPLRWSFSPKMHGRMAQCLATGDGGYGLLIVAKLEGDTDGIREVRYVKKPEQVFSFVTFPCAGKWSVGLFLFERYWEGHRKDWETPGDILRQDLVERYLGCDPDRTFKTLLPSLFSIKAETFSEGANMRARYRRLIAAHVVGVEVPTGIFAKRPSPKVQAFGNYFPRRPPVDECAFRTRFILMCLFGWAPYAVCELAKRLLVLVVGFVGMLFLVKGAPGMMRNAFRPAIRFNLDAADTFELDDRKHFVRVSARFNGWGNWLTPAAFIVYGVISWLVYLAWPFVAGAIVAVWDFLFWSATAVASRPWLLYTILGVFALVAIIWGVVALVHRVKERRHSEAYAEKRYQKVLAEQEAQRAHALDVGLQQAEVIQSQRAVLVGDQASTTVSLEALPPELQTWGLRFASLKRQVCRPFG